MHRLLNKLLFTSFTDVEIYVPKILIFVLGIHIVGNHYIKIYKQKKLAFLT